MVVSNLLQTNIFITEEVIMVEGDEADKIYFIFSGNCSVYIKREDSYHKKWKKSHKSILTESEKMFEK